MSYLSASAVVGAPGPCVRILGTQAALVIHDLDPQENLLKSGLYPEGGTWAIPTASRAFIHRGDEVEEIVGENGNYALFYSAVAEALAGTSAWPISNDDVLLVAQIIDQAREISSNA